MSPKFKKILAGLLSTMIVLSTEVPAALSVAAAAQEVDNSEEYDVVADESDYVDSDPEEYSQEQKIGSVSEYFRFLRENGSEDVPDENSAANFVAALPTAVDNSTNQNAKYLPAVGNQGDLGACVSWATVYYQYTYMHNKTKNITTTAQNTFSPSYINNFLKAAGGANFPKSYQLMETQGSATVADVPIQTQKVPDTNYLSWHATGKVWENSSANRVVKHVFFSQEDENSVYPVHEGTPVKSPDSKELDVIKTALANGEILVFAACIGDETMPTTTIKKSSVSGVDNSFVGQQVVYCHASRGTNHAMTIVGYNDNIWTDINSNNQVDEGEMGAFKMLNSWGATYGNNGYMWIAYDALNTVSAVKNAPVFSQRGCIFKEVGSVLISSKQSDASGLFLCYTLNSARRVQTPLTISAKNNTTGATISKMVTPYNLDNSVGTVSYNGTTTASDGVMAYDLANVIPGITSQTLGDYTWTVNLVDLVKDDNPLVVKEVKIADRNKGKEYTASEANNLKLDGISKIITLPVPQNEITKNQSIIYYKGYSNPYIHYQVAGGSWTAVPGVKMIATSEMSGYTHKYTIDLGTATYATVCFNDGNNSWDSNNGSNYKFEQGTYTYSNGTITKVTPPTPANLTAKVSVTGGNTVPTNHNITIVGSATGGTAPYQYKYTYTTSGVETTIKDFSTQTSTPVKFATQGTYVVTVTVKDSTGKTSTATTTVTAAIVDISGIKASKTTVKAGETVTFTASSNNYRVPVTYKYAISGNGVSQTLTTASNGSASWTPSKEGTYTLTVTMLYNGSALTTKTMSYTVEKSDVTENQVTIYYKGYSTPYIHYQAGTGSWTNAPGYAMTATTEQSGYTHKYTINLGTATYATVCFNNGSGNWDSNNGSNYKFNKGTFGFSNGNIVEISKPTPTTLTAKVNIQGGSYMPTSQSIFINASAEGGTAPYQYKFSFVENGNEKVIRDFSSNTQLETLFVTPVTCKVLVTVKDANSKTAQASTMLYVSSVSINSLTADKSKAKVGETVKFKAVPNNANMNLTYRYTIKVDGSYQMLTTNSDNSASWTPTKEGTFDVTANLLYNGKVVASKVISYTVEKSDPVTENTITIYYKGYSTPYIHYQVDGGSWTNAPGYAMTATNEVSGYTHKYTIKLGQKTFATVCFNNGSNQWDSNGGSNYKFNKGTYTFSNGTITPYNPTPAQLTANVSILGGNTVPINQNVTINASAAGGKGSYQYKYTYSIGGSETVIKDFSTSTSASVKFTTPGTYIVTVTVKDAADATKQATATVGAASMEITGIRANKTTVKTGETVTFTVSSNNSKIPVTYRFNISGNGTSQTLTASGNTASWTPNKEGTYTIAVTMLYNGAAISTKSMSYTVEKGDDVNLNQVVIYYKGYSTPYVHYQVGSGNWTTPPGKAMTATSEMSGYTHKYTIDLGTQSYANVCFNDGKGNWDSRNGANYRFTKGKYTFSNGVITAVQNKAILVVDPLTAKPSISAKTITLGDTITAKCDAEGGTGSYKYAFYYRKSSSSKWVTTQNFGNNNTVSIKPAVATSYEVCIKVKDGNGTLQKKYFTVNVQKKFENVSSISTDSIKLGETITATAAATGGSEVYTYGVYYKKHTSTKWTTAQSYGDNNVVNVKPAAATTYDVCIKVKDSNGTITKQYFAVKVTK